jgi:dipeptidyl aminopeptidase/acylaminoacyl peptidase
MSLRASEPPTAAQEMRARYERAAAFQNFEAARFGANTQVNPFWIKGTDTFWYKRETEKGYRVVLVNAAQATASVAFDPLKVAAHLAKETGKKVDGEDLPVTGMRLTLSPTVVSFTAFKKDWTYDVAKDVLAEVTGAMKGRKTLLIAPDGAKAAFLKDFNLWIRDLKTGEEKPLTTDGAQFYAYSVDPEATGRPAVCPEAVWSPDSSRIFTAQVDDRQVKDLPIIDFVPKDGSVRPVARAVRTALPGDDHVTMFRLAILDVKTGKQVPVHYVPLPSVRMNDTPFGGGRAWWSADSRTAYVVEIERGERRARLIAIDAATGQTRTVFEETADHYLELGPLVYAPVAILPLPASHEVVWYSERTGWAHLYLYDLETGALKRPLTSGNWLVRGIVGFDAPRRDLYVTLAGREPGRNPYYREIARVNLDTGTLTTLSASDADHDVRWNGDMEALTLSFMGEDMEGFGGVSPSGAYFVETVARADKPSQTVLRDREGKQIMIVETADASRLPKGWHWPEPVTLTAADGKTELAGLVFQPGNLAPGHTYPVIDFIYGGPQVANVPTFFGGGQGYITSASLAELGFYVVIIDGRGTSERDRAFHEASYGAAETASNVEDHIAGIRQLATRYPAMDLTRVGITGFSGGGYMTASAMLRFPDFFKVGVAGSGNHDQRLFWHSWGERYQGLLDGDNYLPQANLTYAKNLKGKLLFIHGLMDFGVHPGGLFQLTQALMNENKDFDLVLMPQAAHELPGYAMRRMWDFFVRNLAGEAPPDPPMALKSSGDLMKERMMRLMGEEEEQKKASKQQAKDK